MHLTIDQLDDMKDEIKFAIDSFDITRYSSKTPTSSLRKDRLNFQDSAHV